MVWPSYKHYVTTSLDTKYLLPSRFLDIFHIVIEVFNFVLVKTFLVIRAEIIYQRIPHFNIVRNSYFAFFLENLWNIKYLIKYVCIAIWKALVGPFIALRPKAWRLSEGWNWSPVLSQSDWGVAIAEPKQRVFKACKKRSCGACLEST